MKISLIKCMVLVATIAGVVACSNDDHKGGVDLEGSWISYYENAEFWNLFTFNNDATVSYLSGDGIKFQGTYQYDTKEESVTINVTNSNDESYLESYTCAVTEADGNLLLDYGEGDTEKFSPITPSSKVVGEWRWRSGNEWKKYIFKSNGEFDLIDEKGNQSRGKYTYHKADNLLVISTEYAESGSLGDEMFFISLYNELIILEEPNGDIYVFENIK